MSNVMHTLDRRRVVILVLLWVATFASLVVLPDSLSGNKDTVRCQAPNSVTLLGDLLIGNGRVYEQLQQQNFSAAIFGDVAPILASSDIVFANFEGALTDGAGIRDKGLPRDFSVGSDTAVLEIFNDVPQVVLSFANNHSADYGASGLTTILDAADGRPNISAIGLGTGADAARAPAVFGEDERVAFIALTDLLPERWYATSSLGVAKLDRENLQASIDAAREAADVVIVSLHTAEDIATRYQYEPDAHQRLFARMAIDMGADVVVGHHPHGLQRFEMYKGGIIFHSLGVFLYNPEVSDRYPKESPLHGPTQLEGGGVVELTYCDGTLQDLAVTPMVVAEQGGVLTVKEVFNWRAYRDTVRMKHELF